MVQWLAASQRERELVFCTFGEEKRLEKVEQVLKKFGNYQIGKIVEVMMRGFQEKSNELF